MTPEHMAAAKSSSLGEWIIAEPAQVVVENISDAIASATDAQAEQIKWAFAKGDNATLGAAVRSALLPLYAVYDTCLAEAQNMVPGYGDLSDYTGDAA